MSCVLLAAGLPVAAQSSFDCMAPPTPILSAPVVLGNGTPGSASAAQLQAALDAGGAIRLAIGNGTLVLAQQLRVTRATTLDAGGATLSGGGLVRVIEVSNPGLVNYTFNLLNATLANGNARTATGDEFARSGGAILNDHGAEPWRAVAIRLFNVRLSGNLAVQTAQDGGGGGLYVVGLSELTIVGSTIENNEGSNGGGLYSLGSAQVNLFDTTVADNLASGSGGNPGSGGNGGGIGIDGATRNVNLCRVQLLHNQSGAFGAGLFTVAYDQSSFTRVLDSRIAGNNSTAGDKHTGGIYLQGGPFSIRGSTFRDNQAAGYGALGLFDHGGVAGNGDITNSTFTGNLARSGLGGAMAIQASGGILIQNTTIADNHAQCAVCFAGGIANSAGLAITIRNTLLQGNTGGNAFNPWALLNPVAGSNNLQWPQVRPGSFGQQELPATPGSSFGDALLVAPADNGGLTETMALPAASPAVDAGTGTGTPALDQRGAPRFGAPDIGAYEQQPIEAALFANGFEAG